MKQRLSRGHAPGLIIGSLRHTPLSQYHDYLLLRIDTICLFLRIIILHLDVTHEEARRWSL